MLAAQQFLAESKPPREVSEAMSDEVVLLDYTVTHFLLPASYINPPLTKESLGKFRQAAVNLLATGKMPPPGTTDSPEIAFENRWPVEFAYKLPSGAPFEENTWTHDGVANVQYSPQLQSIEAIVQFSIPWPFLPGLDSSNEFLSFKRAKAQIDDTGQLLSEPRLDEHSRRGNITGYHRYEVYYDDGDLAVRLKCSPWKGSEAPPNPICYGPVMKRSLNLSMEIKFPSPLGQVQNEPHWRQVVEMTVDLAASWRVR